MNKPFTPTSQEMCLGPHQSEFKEEFEWGWRAPMIGTWCRNDYIYVIKEKFIVPYSASNQDIVLTCLGGGFGLKIGEGDWSQIGQCAQVLIKPGNEIKIASGGCALIVSKTPHKA